MSGFLSRLIQRSLSPQSSVRPRLGSVIEPAAPAPEPMPDAVMDAVATHRTEAQQRRDAVPEIAWRGAHAPPASGALTDAASPLPTVERASRPDPLLPAATTAPATEVETASAPEALTRAKRRRNQTRADDAPQPRVTPEAASRYLDAAAAPAMTRASESDAATATRVSRVGPRTKPSAPLQANIAEARVATAPRARDRAIKPAVPEPPTDASAPETLRGRAHDAAPASAQTPAPEQVPIPVQTPAPAQAPASVQAQAPAPAILKPRLPYPEPVAQSAQLSASLPTEPTVHVTIGRVEIRAVAAAATPTRAAPSKPALSLSDYLQRRDGSRR